MTDMGLGGKDKEMLVLGLVLIFVGFWFSLCWPLIIIGLILATIGGIKVLQAGSPSTPQYGYTYPPQQNYPPPASPQYQYPPQYQQQPPQPQQYPPPPQAPPQAQYGPPGADATGQPQYGGPAMPQYCQRCGAELSPLGTFCPKCGHGR
jgi:hypothetical protein